MKTVGSLAAFAAFVAAFFAAAGTLRWTAAWVYLGFYATSVTVLVVWLKRRVMVIALAGALGAWVFRENAYLASYVRIQTDRGHKVCTTGPYRIVRHPMYAAIILLVLATPPALGSLYGLVPAGLIAGLFIVRTALEDRCLRAELPGYDEYSAAPRWKLAPGVW
jgi:protein-S-isoprenylcysteine O-methyltransferase Ste14